MRKLVAATALAGVVALGGSAVAAAAPAPREGGDRPALARMGHARALPRHAVRIAAEAIGIDRRDLREAWRDRQSLAQVAQARDVDPKTVVDAIVAAANERIDRAVADGRIDADRAAEVKARVPELAERFVHHEPDRSRRKPAHRRRAAAVKVAADAIGITARDLVADLRDGKTIAQVAAAHDVDPRAVVDALVARVADRVERAVAGGKIDAERGEELVARARERLTRRVDAPPRTPAERKAARPAR